MCLCRVLPLLSLLVSIHKLESICENMDENFDKLIRKLFETCLKPDNGIFKDSFKLEYHEKKAHFKNGFAVYSCKIAIRKAVDVN